MEVSHQKMSNAKFRNDLRKVIDKAKTKESQFVRKVLLELDKRVVMKSPVDTGRFRANWYVGDAKINDETTQETDPSGLKSIARSALEINSLTVNGQIIYITNSLPYSYRLEYEGWSTQAPQGMVRVTIEEMSSIGQVALREVK
jgi:hypothetical protein